VLKEAPEIVSGASFVSFPSPSPFNYGLVMEASTLRKYTFKVSFKEWIKSTSGYDHRSSGVKFMRITVEAGSLSEAREEAKKKLLLIGIEGNIEEEID